MRLAKLLLIGVCFCLSFIEANGQKAIKELEKFNEKIELTINQYTENGQLKNVGQKREFHRELKELVAEWRKLRKEFNKGNPYDYTFRFLRNKIMCYYLDLNKEIRYPRLQTTDEITNFQQTFLEGQVKKYLFINDKEVQAILATGRKTFDRKEEAQNELNKEAEAFAKIFGISVHQEFATKINPIDSTVRAIVIKYERELYETATKNKTLKQYKTFLDICSKNQFAYDAFKNYYYLFTIDGELKTHQDFENKCGALGKESACKEWGGFMERLKADTLDTGDKFFDIDRKLAKKGERLFTNTFNEPKLEEYMREAYPKETAFVALQKLLKENLLKYDYDYCEAKNSLLGYQDDFAIHNKYNKTHEKYQSLITILDDLITAENREISQPLKNEINKKNNDTELIFSRNGNKFLVRGNGTTDEAGREFVRNKNNWDLITADHTNGQSPLYWYKSTNELERGNLPDIFSRITGKGDISINEDLILDVRIFKYGSYEIAFFVSRTDYDRYNDDGNEYNSPHNVDRGLRDKFKCRDFVDKEGSYFHGDKKGNTNTDIYYCIRKGSNSAWEAHHFFNLGNIVNTGFCERSPILSADGKYLYFSSEGHSGLGGLDIFRVEIDLSTIDNFKISVPTDGTIQNMSKYNSPYDDLSFYKFDDKQEVYFSSNRANQNDFDIYHWKEGMNERNENAATLRNFSDQPFKDSLAFSIYANSCLEIVDSLIKIGLNETEIEEFEYDSNTGEITGKLKLEKGENKLKILIKQEGGESIPFEKTLVGKDKPAPPLPSPAEPKININIPSSTSLPTINIRGNIDAPSSTRGKSKVKVMVNGIPVDNVDYNPSTGQISVDDLPLKKNQKNTVVVEVENPDGTKTSKSMEIGQVEKVQVDANSPTIEITYSEKTTLNPITMVMAEIDNAEKQHIRVTLNGQPISSFSFKNGLLQIKGINLEPNGNSIEISAKTSVGTDLKEVSVFRGDPDAAPKPIIKYIKPKAISQTININDPDTVFYVEARIYNVKNREGVAFLLNKTPYKFGFNNDKYDQNQYSTLTTSLTLDAIKKTKGKKYFENIIEIKAKNEYGSDLKSQQIIFDTLLPEQCRKQKSKCFRTIKLDKNKCSGSPNEVCIEGNITDGVNPLKGVDIIFDDRDGDSRRRKTDGNGGYYATLYPKEYSVSVSGTSGGHYHFMDGLLMDFTGFIGDEVMVVKDLSIPPVSEDCPPNCPPKVTQHVFFFDFNEVEINNVEKVQSYYENLLPTWRESVDVIRIAAYADSVGSNSYNCDLSFRRANKVKEFLVSLGYDRDKIIAIGVGETQRFNNDFIQDLLPNDVLSGIRAITDDSKKDDELKRQLNRRAYIIIEFEGGASEIQPCRN